MILTFLENYKSHDFYKYLFVHRTGLRGARRLHKDEKVQYELVFDEVKQTYKEDNVKTEIAEIVRHLIERSY